MKRLILIIVVLFSVSLYSQINRRSAEKYFNRMDYSKSAIELEVVIKKDGENQELLEMISDSYYLNSNYKSAEPWLKKLIDSYEKSIDAEYFFKYANTLKSVKKQDEADFWIQKFVAAKPNDTRALNYQSQKRELDLILKKPVRFEIENSSLNSKYSDFSAALYKDEIIFTSSRNRGDKGIYERTNQPYLDLYKSNIDEKGYPKLGVQLLPKELNTDNHDGVVTFSKDGLTMYFTRTNSMNPKFLKNESILNNLKLYKAQLINNEWKNIESLPFNNDNYSVGHPALNADGTKLYFVSDIPGGFGLMDLYVVDINQDGTYGAPKNLGSSINTEGREMFPYVKDNFLYFSSDGHWGLGALDVYKVDLSETPLKPVNMGVPVNSGFDDFSFMFDENRNFGYVSSNREGGQGDDDLYLLKTKVYNQFVYGKVLDVISNNLLPESIVTLYDEEGKEINSTKVLADASYKIKIDAGKSLKITGTKKDYSTDIKDVYTTDGVDLEINLMLKKQEFIVVRGKCIVKIDPIYFDFDKHNIRPDAAIELDKVVEIMKKYPELIIEGGSHTDSRGRFKYNETLSYNRAKSTVDYIISKGINSNRISAKGYGETMLVNGCADGVKCTEDEHQLNRRTEFTVVNLDEIISKYPDICGTEDNVYQ